MSKSKELISEVRKIITRNRLIMGSIVESERTCGKHNCYCAQGKKKHKSAYLYCRYQYDRKQIYIPEKMLKKIKAATNDYASLKNLLCDLSDENLTNALIKLSNKNWKYSY